MKTKEPSKEPRETFRINTQNNDLDRSFAPFTDAMTTDAIRATKNSTAVGPNGLTPLHLKHLGPNAIRYLTRLFNLSVQNADIPAIWRQANIIPIAKPGKPGEFSSYLAPLPRDQGPREDASAGTLSISLSPSFPTWLSPGPVYCVRHDAHGDCNRARLQSTEACGASRPALSRLLQSIQRRGARSAC